MNYYYYYYYFINDYLSYFLYISGFFLLTWVHFKEILARALWRNTPVYPSHGCKEKPPHLLPGSRSCNYGDCSAASPVGGAAMTSAACRESSPVWRRTGAADPAGKETARTVYTWAVNFTVFSCPVFSFEPRSAAGEDVSVCLWETSLVTEVKERETTWWTASSSALPPYKHKIWDLCCC